MWIAWNRLLMLSVAVRDDRMFVARQSTTYGTMVKGGCADLRMWQRVKDGCGCGEHPPFTHRTQPRLWTNKWCITLH